MRASLAGGVGMGFLGCGGVMDFGNRVRRPNIIIIMSDDLGYSDLGCYGSEISTPNLDRLTRGGVRFTNFYNAARCCPSRASLLTGLHPHQAGVGAMVKFDRAEEENAYQGYLNNHCVTLAEVLKGAGYKTMISGKWHVGEIRGQWPVDRGFDHHYGLVSGAMNYFDIDKSKSGMERIFAIDDKRIKPPNEDFYATDAFTDAAVDYLDKKGRDDKPFFLYLAYTAPHYPLHAKEEDIEKYKGRYMEGWEKLREERYARMQRIGVITEKHKLSPLDERNVAWDEVEDKEEMDLKMAIYAGQVESMDRGIGRVLDKVAELGKTDDTLVVFLSDNGACAETGPLGGVWRERTGPLGGVDSYESYGLCWANAGNTPYRKFKQFTHEGGILTPFIASWPRLIKDAGGIVRERGYIVDMMVTLCDITGAEYPRRYKGHEILATEGKSLLPLLAGRKRSGHEVMCWEHIGNKAVWRDDWKLVKSGKQDWELYHLDEDPTELNDLAKEMSEKVVELENDYLDWALRCGARV